MELKDFVKESLVQISGGIDLANFELRDSDAMVNPRHVRMHSDNAQSYGRTKTRAKTSENDKNSQIVQKVEFDVAVVIESGQQESAGAKLSIASIGIGGNLESGSSNRSESRIKFSIPMVFPAFENKS